MTVRESFFSLGANCSYLIHAILHLVNRLVHLPSQRPQRVAHVLAVQRHLGLEHAHRRSGRLLLALHRRDGGLDGVPELCCVACAQSRVVQSTQAHGRHQRRKKLVNEMCSQLAHPSRARGLLADGSRLAAGAHSRPRSCPAAGGTAARRDRHAAPSPRQGRPSWIPSAVRSYRMSTSSLPLSPPCRSALFATHSTQRTADPVRHTTLKDTSPYKSPFRRPQARINS
eukprot:COSAG06_NODE_204_length_20326_cov_8.096060_10_plen_227_part_00